VQRLPALAALGILAILAPLAMTGCDSAASTAPGGPAGGGSAPAVTRVPQETTGDPATAAATGSWRRVPFPTDPSFAAAQESGCRGGPVAIPASATRVVTDVRGQGRLLLVFASATRAFLCVTSVDDPADPVDVESFSVPAAPVADDGIDLVYYTETGTGSGTLAFAVGRVGPAPKAVIAGFVDQTFVFGAMGGGWYSMWWPVTVACDGIASVNGAHVVLESTHAPCEPTEGPSPSG